MKILNSGNLYRIIPYHQAVQLFTKKQMYFSHPSRWEDPFETRVKHSIEHMLFAQCWCRKSMSDAMWRIYSPHQTSVRIKTTTEKLTKAMKDYVKKNDGYKMRLRDVIYLNTKDLLKETSKLAKELNNQGQQVSAASKAADILLQKRNAFNHEEEVRAILYCPSTPQDITPPGILIDIRPHDLIESILIDPRAPDEILDAFKNHLVNTLEFKGAVKRSGLYQAPRILQEEDNDD